MTKDEAIEAWNRVSADESWVNPHAHIENLTDAGDRLLAALATPAPVAAPPADLVAIVRRVMNAYTRELEARNAWVKSAPQSRESFDLFEIVQAREADTSAAFLALAAFPLPEVPK